jgi:hypothetical protein
LKAGGVSAWSTSCTALRKQLISSGLGKEYEINLQSDMTIKASNYTDVLSKGDVVFFYCPGCVNIDGKPYIHVVLYNGMDSNGYMKAYSHNAANSGKSKYQYSSKCYSCGTKISKAYVYHFNNGYDPQGCIDEVTGGAGTIRIAGWAFDKDSSNPIDVKVYVGGDSNSGSACYTITANQTRDDVAKVYSVSSNHGFSKEISIDKTGTLEVYIYAINASGTGGKDVFLGKKTVTVSKPFSVNFESNKYELSANQQRTIQFTFKGDGISSLAYGSSNSDVCDASWGNVDWSSGIANMTINAKSAGKSSITVVLQDYNNNALYQKSFDVVVSVEKGNISFDKDKVTLNLSDNKSDIANLTWDFKSGVQVNPDYDPEVISVSYEEIMTNSAKIKYEALKEGSTVLKFTIVDGAGNEMGTAKLTIVVDGDKETVSEGDDTKTQINEEKIDDIDIDKNTESEELEGSISTEVENNEQISEVDEIIVEINTDEENDGDINSVEISNDEQELQNNNQDIEDTYEEQKQQQTQLDSNNQSTQTIGSDKNTNKNNSKKFKGYLKQLYDYANEIGMTDDAKNWIQGKINQYKWW